MASGGGGGGVRRAGCTAPLHQQQTKHSGDCHPAFLIIFRLLILREQGEKSSHLTPDVPACPFLGWVHAEGIVTPEGPVSPGGWRQEAAADKTLGAGNRMMESLEQNSTKCLRMETKMED